MAFADLSLKIVFWTHKFAVWDSLIWETASQCHTHKESLKKSNITLTSCILQLRDGIGHNPDTS